MMSSKVKQSALGREWRKSENNNFGMSTKMISYERKSNKECDWNRSIDRLSNDILILIFERLPFLERMKLELVSKRWSGLVKKYGWANFHEFSISHVKPRYVNLSKIAYIKNYKSKYQAISQRCGKFLYEIQLAQFPESEMLLLNLMPIAKNLQHLDTGYTISLTREQLVLIASGVPGLKTACLPSVQRDAWDGLAVLLKEVTKLEYLHFNFNQPLRAFDFIEIPPSLKYLRIGHNVPCSSLLQSMTESGCQLEVLHLVLIEEMFVGQKFNIPSLKYLAVDSYGPDLLDFLSSFRDLNNVRALELLDFYGLDAERICDVVAFKCNKLEHFRLDCEYWLGIEALEIILQMPKLTSLSLFERVTTESFEQFFQDISSKGILKYFESNAILSMESLCHALETCKDLHRIGWICSPYEYWLPLLETLDRIHAGELPSGPNDERLLHLFPRNLLPVPEHPWISRNHGFGQSVIKERHRLGCLSSVPEFLATRQGW